MHAADLGVVAGGQQARIAVGLQGGLDLGDHGHTLAVELRLVFVGFAVVGGEQIGGDGLGRVERGREGVDAVFAVARAIDQVGGLQPLEHQEIKMAAVDDAVAHAESSFTGIAHQNSAAQNI